MDQRLPPDFKEFLRLLASHGVEYLPIGGYAVGYYGFPRATQDMDVWIAIGPRNAERLVAALREFGFATPNLSAELFLRPESIIQGRRMAGAASNAGAVRFMRLSIPTPYSRRQVVPWRRALPRHG